MDEPTDEPDNVVHVAFGVKGWAHKPVPPGERTPYHNCFASTLVDVKERTVECAKCGKIHDAFEVLNYWASEGRHTLDWIGALRSERAKLGESIEALKLEEQRVKARVKNAVKKDADAAVLLERKRIADAHSDMALRAREIMEAAERLRCMADPEYARARRRQRREEREQMRLKYAGKTIIHGGT